MEPVQQHMQEITQKRYDLFLKDFETIVNIDSSTDNKSGVEQVARFFEKRLQEIGFEVKILKLANCNKSTHEDDLVPCLEATNRPGAEKFDIMMLGHMDTVFPPGEVKKRPFKIEGDRATGPGVCDMKGGLLVALHVLEKLKENGTLDDLSVCVAFNGDEETGSEASQEWIKQKALMSQRVFVFEPCRPGYRFVLQRKGGGWFFVTAKGISAHAGADPEKGANAVVEIAHQIVAINKLNDLEIGTSAQVTVVSGGDKVNIIPNEAKASVDVRISRPEEVERVNNFFRSLSQNTHIPGVTVSVEGFIDRPPMVLDEKTRTLWNLFEKKSRELDKDMKIEGISTGGCSDGNFTSALGVPTIDGMGIVGANSHREDEYVELASINRMIGLITDVCQVFCIKK
ncbi:Carboxypeptidase family Cpg2 [Desulfamplus magnetovallimortis]|uniref:Carboxypeptidase family Cpg2 n=2 Tax=Desulfamplus magnetovallimortis TaxID=1246637 RepID=A0A1W1HIQ3_9BACT|nr:Carboxypeptidase family Cpg2 [Desulfamplus magnetovallimortis]